MVASNRDSLCVRILRSKYKVEENWLRADTLKKASPIWKAIESTKSIITKGACYLIEMENQLMYGLTHRCHGFKALFRPLGLFHRP